MDQQICGATLSQAIFDVAIAINSIENLGSEWTPNFSIQIYLSIEDALDSPSPYQIIHCKQNWNSSINLENYTVQNIQLGPKQRKQIQEACIFRDSSPINWIQLKELTCYIDIGFEGKKLGTLKYSFEPIIGLQSYLPIFSPSLGLKIQAKIETQILGLRMHKNCANDSFDSIYKGIQFIIHESNRLAAKLSKLDMRYCENQQRKKFNEIQLKQNQSNQAQLKQSSQDNVCGIQQYKQLNLSNSKQTTSQIYEQYEQLKSFKESRIFKSKSQQTHREKLIVFLNKIYSQFSNPLQWNWQSYLQSFIKEGFKQNLLEFKRAFCQQFASQIKNKITKGQSLYGNKKYELLIGKLKVKFEDFGLICHVLDKSNELKQEILSFEGIIDRHLVVLVHGYGANSLAMTYIERTLQYLFPHIDILNSKSNQDPGAEATIEQMGRNLATQVQQYLQKYENPDDVDISFIGYSLGGLVVRASLTHLQVFKLNMSSFISLSVPHLGHASHMNKLAKIGMIAINSIWHSNVIDSLFLKDNKDERLSYLYSLSLHSGLSWFKTINLYGSADDGYVSLNSSLANGKNENYQNNCQLVEEMSNNLNYVMGNSKLSKFQVVFEPQKSSKAKFAEWIVGRESHLAFATSQSFINYFLLQNYKYFRYNQIKLCEGESN